MFYGCSSLESLDLSGWDTLGLDKDDADRSGRMFAGCTSLSEIQLGANYRFAGASSYLSAPPAQEPYTGKWVKRGNKGALTPKELAALHESTGEAATYVWQKCSWEKSGNTWRYSLGYGTYATSVWKKISGSWYRFDSKGIMLTGWQKVGGDWYYLGTNGKMSKGWINLSRKYYYANSSGITQTGWQSINGRWYWFDSSGLMRTGWLNQSGKWYYLNSSGAMETGWKKVSGSYHYFNSTSVMRSSKWIGSYYLLSSGKMATSQWIGRCHVDASGKWDATR